MRKLYNILIIFVRWFASIIIPVFYKNYKGVDPLVIAIYTLIPQKLFRINGGAHWPVDPRSMVTFARNIQVGYGSFPGLSPGGYIQGRNGIIIGDNLRLGPNVGLISANHSMQDYNIFEKAKPIIIGDNVWIGMNSVIMPGVSIGSNTAIGANSVVTKNIPSNSIAFGIPCRVVKRKPPYIADPHKFNLYEPSCFKRP